jgi:hypothetical protein
MAASIAISSADSCGRRGPFLENADYLVDGAIDFV